MVKLGEDMDTRRAAREVEPRGATAVADDVARLRNAIAPDMDFTAAAAAARTLKRSRAAGARSAVTARVAVLGSTTTSQLAQFLDLCLFGHNIDAEIYEAPYGLLRQEILDPGSDLHTFAPQFVFLATTRRDLGPPPSANGAPQKAETAVAAAVEEWESLWRIAHERLGCQIVQNNFDAPPWRPFGNLEASHPGAPGHFIESVNRRLAARAPRWVSIHDLDGLAASVGRWSWGDERFFHLAKLPCAPEHLLAYAHGVAALIAARLGRSRKCLVLDLDNTLWGGVIGDDGMAGIALGQGDAIGEAYVAFQRYVKSIRDRGVILAVCSKNEDQNAREPFEQHPEMVLRLSDISCFLANWDDKAANLRRIAAELNIGLDSLVFVDDNPAERKLVRDLASEVAVPEIPEDPADYVRALDKHRYFEAAALSAEDFKRTEYYRANAERRQTATEASDIDEFLRSLDMRGWIGPIGAMELDRSVQLIGKSNQFNLTTRRHSAADIERMLESPDWDTRVVKLADRFGDNGLISVLLAKAEGDALAVDTWLMSCRVLKRGVEQLLLNELVAIARARGLEGITGEYIPTAKNALVKDHYESLGFVKTGEDGAGRTTWRLSIDEAWTPKTHFIEEDAP
jgi:FkbH-like protein